MKILILDDNLPTLLLIQTLLAGKGWDTAISTRTDGIENILLHLKTSVLLLEVLLKNHDGRTITHNLKHDPRFSSLRIILFSAASLDPESVADSYADDFLFTPFSNQELYLAVEPGISNLSIL